MSLDVHPVVQALAKARNDPGAMKTTTMTFAIFFGDGEGADWVRGRTRALAEKHPSRVVILDANKDETEQSVEPPQKRGEWIEIGVKGANAAELDAALTQLSLPEAPVVLLWIAEALSEDDRFMTLARRSDTTICSTSVARTDDGALRDLAHFVELHPDTLIQDVAYLRLTAWQELVAEFFDDPDDRVELDGLRSVDVTAGSDAEMYYMLGWIASRLRWTLTDAQTFASPGGGNVKFTMTHDGPPRRLSKIALASEHATFTASVIPDDQNAIALDVTGPSPSSRFAPLHTVDLASLVERAILTTTRDDVFMDALSMTKAMMEKRSA